MQTTKRRTKMPGKSPFGGNIEVVEEEGEETQRTRYEREMIAF